MTARHAPEPIEAATRTVSALLTALDGNPGPGAATAYRAALTRHGRNLASVVGPEALAAVLARIRAESSDRSQGEARAAVVLDAWQGIATEVAAA